MDVPLTLDEVLGNALQQNKVSEDECIKTIARKMRKARNQVWITDKEGKNGRRRWEPDHRARAEAAESLLSYLGHHKTTKVEHSGAVDHHLLDKPYDELTPEQIKRKLAAVRRELAALDKEEAGASKGRAKGRRNRAKVEAGDK